MSDDEEEVRCICPNCFGEGWTMVSKARANELKTLEEIESVCPFGEKCSCEEEEQPPVIQVAVPMPVINYDIVEAEYRWVVN